MCVSQDLLETLESIIIDEDKNYCLESIRKTKNAIKVTKSDHNTILSTFKIKWNKHDKMEKNLNVQSKEQKSSGKV